MTDLKAKYPKIFEFFDGNEFAATTFLNKYALRDKDGNIIEDDPNKTIDRVMSVLAEAMPEENKKPSKEWLQRVLKDEYKGELDVGDYYSWKQIFIRANDRFNGVCPQGSILSAIGDYTRPQSISNCYVIASPHDSINGIFKTGEEAANLQKRRAGVGISLTTLRPSEARVSNAAKTSSGVPGWMDYFSNICRSIGQSGRRGALLLSLDIKHPDALLFAKSKQDLNYCTGANISLQISDEFMECVSGDKEFIQQFPIDSTDPIVTKTVRAKELWNEIIKCAHNSGEPGLLMWDSCIKNLPASVYKSDGFYPISVNPCGEQILSANDSCRLTSICLTQYVKNKFSDTAYFDFNSFERDVRIAMRLMDSVVTAETKAVGRIIEKIKRDSLNDEALFKKEFQLWNNVLDRAIKGRRTGLGTHGLADCLAQLTLKYDSQDALQVVDKIYQTLMVSAYDESTEMSKDYGSFPIFDFEKEIKECLFIQRLPSTLLEKIKKYGRRNITILTNSPTGTISILSRCSSGIEPTFRQMYIRRRKINATDLKSKVDFIDPSGDKWMEFPQFEQNILRYFAANNEQIPEVKSETELLKLLPEYFITSDKIDWKSRVRLQGTIQQYMDASISSTINLPNSTPVEVVSELYMEAWKSGLKGVTVYRDGCRTGVLVSNETYEKQKKQSGITRSMAPTRPEKLPCEVHFTTIRGQRYVVIVGLMRGAVYEIFFGKYNNQIPERSFSGFVEKKGKSKYILNFIDEIDFKQVDINKYFDNEDYAAATRLISMSLRHGVPLNYIIEQLQKASSSIVEFGSAVSRILKKYIKVEDIVKDITYCKNCESTNIEIKHEDGCISVVCKDCAFIDSKCN